MMATTNGSTTKMMTGANEFQHVPFIFLFNSELKVLAPRVEKPSTLNNDAFDEHLDSESELENHKIEKEML